MPFSYWMFADSLVMLNLSQEIEDDTIKQTMCLLII